MTQGFAQVNDAFSDNDGTLAAAANAGRADAPDTSFAAAMFDRSDIPFSIIRIELDSDGEPCDWTFVYANEALAKLDGLPLADLQGHRFYEIFPTATRKWLERYRPAAFDGQNVEFEDVFRERDLYLHVNAAPMNVPDRKSVV